MANGGDYWYVGEIALRECLLAESAFTLERIGASGGFESELIYSRTPFHSRTPLTGRNDWGARASAKIIARAAV